NNVVNKGSSQPHAIPRCASEPPAPSLGVLAEPPQRARPTGYFELTEFPVTEGGVAARAKTPMTEQESSTIAVTSWSRDVGKRGQWPRGRLVEDDQLG